MKIKADITIGVRYETNMVHLEVRDRVASVRFLELAISSDQFLAAIRGLACVHVEADVRGLDKVGKKMKIDTIEFRMPDDVNYRTQKDTARLLAKKYCPKGWVPDTGFSSQDSFFYRKDDNMNHQWARTMIRTWVDKEEDDGEQDHQ